MLTFLQFISENQVPDVNPFGYLRPGQTAINKKAKDRGHWNHFRIAKKLGYKTSAEPIKKDGWVRYEHLHNSNILPDGTHYAGYEFRHDPESHRRVAEHLKRHVKHFGPFNKVVFDVHHSDGIHPQEFKSSDDALRHLRQSLDESLLLEGPAYYKHYGWIKPDGSYIDGDKHPTAKTHQDILPKHLKGTGQEDYRKAFAAGLVRHGQMKYDKSHVFHAGRINHQNVNTIDNFLMTKKHQDMGGDKYRMLADEGSNREINGHSREHFSHSLHN